MSAHTAGSVRVTADGRHIASAEDGRICAAPEHIKTPRWAANARRLAACWNACEGISTEVLELDANIGHTANRLVDQAISQRDELLAALQALLLATQSVDSAGYIAYIDVEQAVDQATAAIAKVAGSAS